MTHDPSHEVFARLAAVYALGGLEGAERQRFEQHLEICRSCVDEVSSFLPVSRALLSAAPAMNPPPRLRERIVGPRSTIGQPDSAADPAALARLDPVSAVPATPLQEGHPRPPAPSVPPPPPVQASPTPSPPPAPPPSRKRGSGAMSTGFQVMAVGCLAIAGALGWYAAQQVNVADDLRAELSEATLRERVAGLDASATRQLADALRGHAEILAADDVTDVELEGQPGAENAVGRAFISTSRGSVLVASAMPLLPPGQTYQVWFVLPGEPVSAGFARVDDVGRLFEALGEAPDTDQLIAVAVTMEPEGGVDMPSGNVLLLGRTE